MSEHPNDFVVGHKQFADIESLLKRALAPVEPSKELEARLETTLGSLVGMAADELEAWEMSAMRDPRNWGRPVAAIVVGGVAAGGLVLVRARPQQKKKHATGLQALEKSIRGVANDIEKRLRN